MLTLLPHLRDDTVGIVASGHVSDAEYESVLVPAVETAIRKHKKLRLLYELSSDEGFAPGAVWAT